MDRSVAAPLISNRPAAPYTSMPKSPSSSAYAASPVQQRQGDEDGVGLTPERPKKKQKRNKPTLSCEECVERKTKCDRGRPTCLTCTKRGTHCTYAYAVNITETQVLSPGVYSGSQHITKPPRRKATTRDSTSNPLQHPNPLERSISRGSTSSSNILLSNVPYSHPSASNVFGIGSEHPFANYWTCQGGLAETISVLPEKLQSDILLERYFECVDPVYPMIHRQTFYANYEHFWSLLPSEKTSSDGTLVALIFSMLAMGTQFVTTTGCKERQQTAEFYVSAAHQSLRMASYLNKASVRSIQAMVLITYFLINDNHASDGWAFAGILLRQAYAMGLHRDPNIVCPNASIFEKQLRRKLWQAVLLQDTFLTVLLSLPPSATHTDVNVADLTDDSNSIANSDPTDTAYIRGCWTLANLVQESICSPRSLDLPISSSAHEKEKLLSEFGAIYRGFPDIFRSPSLSSSPSRLARQTLFLTSNYFHNVMLVHSSSCAEVPVNVRGTFEAAHYAITAFFSLYEMFEAEAKVWWVFNHRAFLEAMCIGDLLKIQTEVEMDDPVYIRAKNDIVRMIKIMQEMADGEGHGTEVANTRAGVLSQYL